jgi:hypothetical protein
MIGAVELRYWASTLAGPAGLVNAARKAGSSPAISLLTVLFQSTE